MKNFDNKQIMITNLSRSGFTVTGNDIFKGTEYAGSWEYINKPLPGKEANSPVRVDLLGKYQD